MKRFILTVIFLAFAACLVQSADLSTQIIGKWKAVGSDCDEKGDCKSPVKEDNIWIRFNADGSADLADGGKNEKVSWSIDGDVLVLMMGNEKIRMKVLGIRNNVFLFRNERRDSIQKMVRVD